MSIRGITHVREGQLRLVGQLAPELARPPTPTEPSLEPGLARPGRQQLFPEGYWGPHLLGPWPGEREVDGLIGLVYDLR